MKGIADGITRDYIWELFSPFGAISDIKIITDILFFFFIFVNHVYTIFIFIGFSMLNIVLFNINDRNVYIL